MYLTVTEDEQGAGLQQVAIEEILYMQFDNGILIAVYTENGNFFTVGPLRFWEAVFRKANLNFIRLDRGILANLDKIKVVDSDYKIAYFDDFISGATKRCTMSMSGYRTFCDVSGLKYKSKSSSDIKLIKGLSWQTALK
ncbi:hypothetical protein GC101_17170 [Paenibacillus sp. LMG 31459]|uniref:HTH LytTR-type domain-containing protein n=1 Tax=Paenibacillus phytohabitans TaxID=2654978 RepID=A0ABX1YHU9_9BACL|nr:LytTR family transcriptional regulator DNA-binding domain-containing protein [Paenibacillus phytohabitans]NOU80597.1 hypothetical protein [Paenibacillus phytohabitans]